MERKNTFLIKGRKIKRNLAKVNGFGNDSNPGFHPVDTRGVYYYDR